MHFFRNLLLFINLYLKNIIFNKTIFIVFLANYNHSYRMGSKITRALNQNQRRQIVKSSSVPVLIKGFMWGLSLLQGFSMGYIIHSHIQNSIDNQFTSIQQVVMLSITSTLATIVKLNNLLLRAAVVLLIALFFANFLNFAIIGSIYAIWLCIAIIMFGQLAQTRAFPIFAFSFYLAIKGGALISEKVQTSKSLQSNQQSHSPLTIQIVFGVVTIMCSILLTNGMFHTRTKHPAPIPFKYYFEFIKIHVETVHFGAMVFLISICAPLPSVSDFIQPIGAFSLLILIILALVVLRYKFAKFGYFVVCVVALTLNLILPQKIKSSVFGITALGFTNIIVFQAMRVHRLLGITAVTIPFIFGQIVRGYLQIEKSQYKQIIYGVLILYTGLAWVAKQSSKLFPSKMSYSKVSGHSSE